MKKTNVILTITLLLIIYSCSEKPKKNKYDIYNEKATEIITKVLKEDTICDCVLEPPKESLLEVREIEMPGRNNRKDLKIPLNIDNKNDLDSLINLSQKFQIRELLQKSKLKFVSKSTYDTLTTISGKKEVDKIIARKCPKGLLHISKPIFDKNFKIAVIDIEVAIGCLPNFLSIYHFDGNKWIK